MAIKVAFDHQIFSLQRYGGISRYFSELLKHFLSGHAVDSLVIAPLYINDLLATDALRDRVRGYHFPFNLRGQVRLCRSVNSRLAGLYWPSFAFDVIHETYYSCNAYGRSRFRVITLHDVIHELFPHDFPDSAQVTAAKAAAVKRADHIICVSETTRRDAIRVFGFPPDLCSVIRLGGSFPVSATPRNSTRQERPSILYVGQRRGYKNFDVLLRAFSSSAVLRRRHVIISFGASAFTADETRRIAGLGLQRHVYHVGGDDSLLKQHYRAASALVYPSRYEGFGIPPLEAMASRCPVACSTAGSIAEIVGDSGAYFDPDDSDALRSILERLIDDTEYAESLRSRGLRRVADFSWSECAQRTFQTYQELVGKAPRQSEPHLTSAVSDRP